MYHVNESLILTHMFSLMLILVKHTERARLSVSLLNVIK